MGRGAGYDTGTSGVPVFSSNRHDTIICAKAQLLLASETRPNCEEPAFRKKLFGLLASLTKVFSAVAKEYQTVRKTLTSLALVAGFGFLGPGLAAAQPATPPAHTNPDFAEPTTPGVSADKIEIQGPRGSVLVDRVDPSIDPDGYLPEALLSVMAAPPSCVTAYTDGNLIGSWVDVRNGCGYSLRAKVLIANGLDSQCHQFAPGQTIRHTFPLWGRFDGLVSC